MTHKKDNSTSWILLKRVLLLCALGLLLPACSRPCKHEINRTITIIAEKDANQFSAVAVDVVAARDDKLVDQLSAMKALKYFSLWQQLKRDFPATMAITGWEVTPGQILKNGTLKYACDSKAVFVFVSYQTKGDHRSRLVKNEPFSIVLRTHNFEVIE